MIDPELKKTWIEALESDKYPKGVTWLNKDGKFCCLGVLCEVTGAQKEASGGLKAKKNEAPGFTKYFTGGDVSNGSHVEEGFHGLISKDLSALMSLNDSSDTFEECVVPWIKKNL